MARKNISTYSFKPKKKDLEYILKTETQIKKTENITQALNIKDREDNYGNNKTLTRIMWRITS
jgi:hypothetical protein